MTEQLDALLDSPPRIDGDEDWVRVLHWLRNVIDALEHAVPSDFLACRPMEAKGNAWKLPRPDIDSALAWCAGVKAIIDDDVRPDGGRWARAMSFFGARYRDPRVVFIAEHPVGPDDETAPAVVLRDDDVVFAIELSAVIKYTVRCARVAADEARFYLPASVYEREYEIKGSTLRKAAERSAVRTVQSPVGQRRTLYHIRDAQRAWPDLADHDPPEASRGA